MNALTSLITGGFLKGYRTYILAWIVVIQALASYLLGDMTLPQFLEQLPEMAGGLGLASLRAAVGSKET